MAKDGTMRGGFRANQTGRPRKSLQERAEREWKTGKKQKLTLLDIPDGLNCCELEGVDMPPVKEYLSALQRDGTRLYADEIFRETWTWLAKLHCEKLVNPKLLEAYSMSAARWQQCEEAVSKWSFLSKHPTTQAPIQSPYVSMSMNYLKQMNFLWAQIFQVVKENCTMDYSGPTPQDDVMERILSTPVRNY